MKKILYLATIFLITSCNKSDSYLITQIAELKIKLSSLESEVSYLKLQKSWEETATLYSGETKYTLVKSDIGTFATSMSGIVPYANGVRIKLSMGNLTASNINGLSIVASYGSVDEKGLPEYASAKEKEVTFDKQIRSGAWNETTIELPNISPEKFGYIQLKDIRHKGMSLSIR